MAVIPVTAGFASAVADWRQATRDAAALLVRLGTAPAGYPEACVASVEKHGPYIVLAPGVALVHAQVSEDSSEGLAALRLDTPVEFGHPSNDPVDVLLAFSSGGEHMTMIKAVAAGLSGGLAQRLRHADDAAAAERWLREALDV